MKTCPECWRDYGDLDFNYCPIDGVELAWTLQFYEDQKANKRTEDKEEDLL